MSDVKKLVIYHKACNDGFAAALAVWLKYPDAEFVAMHYGDALPDVVGKDVIVVDFSFERDVVEDLILITNSFLLLDHHKSAVEELAGLPGCHLDMNKSGCVLAWEHFHPDELTPRLFDYIQDRDLWRFNLELTKAACAGLSVQERTFENWKRLLNDCLELEEDGRAIYKYKEHCVESFVKKATTRKFLGHDVPVINCTHLISAVGNDLAKGHPFAVMYFDTSNERIYSLRSDEDGLDVSVIASHNGGGGHPHAAAFARPLPRIL